MCTVVCINRCKTEKKHNYNVFILCIFFFFFSDGLFGECSNSDSSVLVLFEQPETEHAEVLQSELANLKSAGYEWHHARTQCLLNYFKVVVVLSLPFKPGFCDEQNLDYALPLLQVNNLLKKLYLFPTSFCYRFCSRCI